MTLGALRVPGPAYWGAWALAGAYNFMMNVMHGPAILLLAFSGFHFLGWALMGVFAMPVIRRYPLRLHWRSWLFHLTFGSALALLDINFGHFGADLVTGVFKWQSKADVFYIAFKGCFHMAVLTYLGFVGVVQGHDAIKLSRTREFQVAELKAASVHAQLQSLKAQLKPHFLFNTLHAIGALMHYDVATAERMLSRLSEMLRTSLRDADSPVVSLKQEIAYTEAYVEIEKIRFEQRLDVSWVVEPGLHHVDIPSFILQPLVENAIKYAVAPRADGGRIVIRAYAQNDSLTLEVEDDGPDSTPHNNGFGIGLANTRSRLAAMYGERQHLELVRSAKGTIARVLIPLPAAMPVAA
jgi:two-component system LytT family sensor kinase